MTSNTDTDKQPQSGSIYFFNSSGGEIYLAHDQLPKKKGHLYLVFPRQELFFRSLSLQSKKSIKEQNLLGLQAHYIPFNPPYLNMIYSSEKRQDKNYFFWVSPAMLDLEKVGSLFYDEVPESLLFKGNPEKIKNYRIFVFKRLKGFEIIYFSGEDFYSLFTTREEDILEAVITLARKFALQGTGSVPVLSEIRLPDSQEETGSYRLEVDLIGRDEQKYFFLPDHFPGQLKKKFSNISQNKQLKSIKNIINLWGRNLNIILILLLVLFLVNAAAYVFLKWDNAGYEERFNFIRKMMNRAQRVEFKLDRIRRKATSYPDHMLYLDTVAEAMDPEAVLIAYTLGEDKITMEGYSPNSLEILNRLRKSGRFKEVKFRSTVTKNVHSNREKFEIDMELLPFSAGKAPAASPQTKGAPPKTAGPAQPPPAKGTKDTKDTKSTPPKPGKLTGKKMGRQLGLKTDKPKRKSAAKPPGKKRRPKKKPKRPQKLEDVRL